MALSIKTALAGVCLFIAVGALPSISLRAQVTTDDSDLCGGNIDCINSGLLHDYILLSDDPPVAAKGKKRESRIQTLQTARDYILYHSVSRQPGNEEDAVYYKYIASVSRALYSEVHEKKTLFSTENIIETYFALRGTTITEKTTKGIQLASEALDAYSAKKRQAGEEARILQKSKRAETPDPQAIWHEVLLDAMRKRFPNEDAETNVKFNQDRYCLFAVTCQHSINSPFPAK